MARPLALALALDRAAAPPLSGQVAGQIREGVLAGTLPVGARLPSTRALARDLGVSRAVTEQAFDQLAAEGWVEGRPGAGTFVSAGAMTRPRHRPPVVPAPEPALVRLDTGTPWIDPRHRAAWRRAWREVSAAPAPPSYDDPAGLRELRVELATHLARTRGLLCDPDEILVTTGTIGGLSQLLAALPARRCRPRGPRLPRGGRGDPGLGPSDPRPPGDRAGHRPHRHGRRLRDARPPAPARAGDARLGTALADRRRCARRGRGDRGRLRLGVPLRRRARSRRSRRSTATASPTSAPPARPLLRACAWAGWSPPPPCTGRSWRAGRSPTTSQRGRCSEPSCRCSATATSTRSCARPAARTPPGRRGSPRRCDRMPSRSSRWQACTRPCRCRRPAR